jgi:hypothetical protein
MHARMPLTGYDRDAECRVIAAHYARGCVGVAWVSWGATVQRANPQGPAVPAQGAWQRRALSNHGGMSTGPRTEAGRQRIGRTAEALGGSSGR